MRVAVISHTYVIRANRGKLESLARLPGIEVLVVVPKVWRNRDIGQRFHVEEQAPGPLRIVALPAWSMGSGSLITYAPVALKRLLQRFRPDLVHLEEEPWSLAALELSFICRGLGIPFTFFTWENTDRRLPLLFRLVRRWVLRRGAGAIAGNLEAKRLLEQHGFMERITVLPQLGVDVTSFQPGRPSAKREGVVVAYVGRLVPQKGILLLLEAFAQLPPDARLMLVGNGPLKDEVLQKARTLGVDGRLELHEGVAHHEVPRYLQQMSVLVLPSLTTPKWKEQFGHVLVEAMACDVPVIGSDSGAIPEVIGGAGLVVPEGNVQALTTALKALISSAEVRVSFAARGRARVLEQYSNSAIGQRLAAFWESVLGRVV